jgi:hypothetical protein
MSDMVIEVYKTDDKAKERAQYWRDRGYTVEQTKSYASVRWQNECSVPAKPDTAWGEGDVWPVVATK